MASLAVSPAARLEAGPVPTRLCDAADCPYTPRPMRHFLHRCLTRTPIIGLLMAALLFRALVPAGFMPVQGETGSIVMQLCSGLGAKPVIVDLDHTGAKQNSGSQLFDHSPCGFAASALSAPPTVFSTFTAAVALQSIAIAGEPAAVTPPAITRAQSPRGPPLI